MLKLSNLIDTNNDSDTNIVIKFQPETEKSYLVNKDYERVVTSTLIPFRKK